MTEDQPPPVVDNPNKDVPCENCGQKGGVQYVDCEVLEGSLELAHLIHTEVENHFRCTLCQADWKERAYL